MSKINFALIGTSAITGWFLEGARADNRFNPVALYSRSHEKGAAFASMHGLDAIEVYTSLPEMLNNKTIDAVYIASPNSLHAMHAIEAMQHGKHVLCEKPFATNLAEARQMVETAGRNGVLLMEAMTATLNPNFAIVRANLGRVGNVRQYTSNFCQYSSRIGQLSSGELPNVFNRNFAGGALMDIGVYTISPMVSLFGSPDDVSARATFLPSGVDAQGTIVCRYGQMQATLTYSKIANAYAPGEIAGSDGNLLLDSIHNLREVNFVPRPEATSGRDSRHQVISLGRREIPDLYFCEVREFIDTLKAGQRQSAINSHQTSLAVMEILDEVRRQIGLIFPADIKS